MDKIITEIFADINFVGYFLELKRVKRLLESGYAVWYPSGLPDLEEPTISAQL